MALRSGYYGVKRFLRDKLETIAGTYDETIKSLFPRSEQAVLGASNFVDFKKTVNISQSVVTLTSDGFTVSGSDTYISSKTPLQNLEVGKTYYASVKIDAFTSTDARFALRSSTNAIKQSVTLTGTGKYSFDFTYADGDYLSILASMGISQTCSITISELQLSLSPNTPYAPYAMTNKELTNSAADQKTAINAIITAATGAADFTAFKTAMEAITPVTRSLSLTKEDITEEVKEDVEPEKTVTKKRTTKKTEEV